MTSAPTSQPKSIQPSSQRPRHFLIYRVVDQHVLLGRVLHDAMEPSRRMGSDETFE